MWMLRTSVTLVVLISIAFPPRSYGETPAVQSQSPLRLGMIGLDTSHVPAFAQLLNDPDGPDHVPGGRVVVAYKGGSPDVPASANRIDRFTAELTEKWGVELVDSIEELCRRVDAVLLMSVDGRVHLEQVRPVLKAGKRVFIDKPFTAGLKDALEIVRLARETGTPFFSTSSLRYNPDVQALKQSPELGTILGALTYGAATIEPPHPDLFWYGIHSVEMLYTLMGPGCETVTRMYADGADALVGRWKDGRIGMVRGIREGHRTFGAVAFGSNAILDSGSVRPPPDQPRRSGYYGLVKEIVRFFETGVPPVSRGETLEIMAFLEAAHLSRQRNGAPVSLSEILPASLPE